MDVHDLTVAYQRRPALWNVDLVVGGPRLVGIVGPNGAGKSTLIKAILGLIPRAGGEVSVFGEPLARARRRVGYVPQRETVDRDFPVSVLDVVLMGTYARLGWFRRPGRRERDWARACLERVGMDGLRDRQIGQLSGGQQQRVFLARALAQDADLYFLDEPMAGVDAATEAAIFELMAEMRRKGKTLLVVHHDLRTVPEYFDDVVLLNTRVIAHGPVERTFNAETLKRTYGGRLNILESLGQALGESRPTD